MNKKYLAVMLAGVMASGVLAGCGPTTEGGDVHVSTEAEENVPIVFAIDGMTGVYSPFFATAAYDSEIGGQVQIGMLSSEGGEYTYGDDEACVVKDMNIKYLDANKGELPNEAGAAYTEYNFLIKKGIKFSDGEDLTIDDVLFNMYVYLDPAYTGSSTMYSTDIVGLEDYRAQGEGDETSLNASASTNANNRLARVDDWCTDRYIDNVLNGEPNNIYSYSGMSDEERAETEADIVYFLSNYDTELSAAYDSAVAGFGEARKTYMFEPGQYWQYFLSQYGIVQYETQSSGKPYKKFVEIDPADLDNFEYKDAPAGTTEEDIDNNIYEVYVYDFSEGGDNWQFKEMAEACADDEAKREWAIELAYEQTVGKRTSDVEAQLGSITDYFTFADTVLASSTTNTLYEYILADEISQLVTFKGKEITGITKSKVSEFEGEDGAEYKLDGEYDVLTITINGIDPKAIWNFAFTVAPQHYYAPADAVAQYVDEDHPLINGVVFSSADFMNGVLKQSERQRVPVGAGPYKASKQGGLGANEKYPSSGEFQNGGRIYYERNTYFDLLDGVENGGPIQNARIKYFQYQKINSNVMLTSLEGRSIDVGTPNATSQNMNELNNYDFLSHEVVRTNGYGYVGINAGKEEVSNVWVRRAIMMALNPEMINSYFAPNTSEPIYRPMSLESWAYPKGDRGTTPYKDTVVWNGKEYAVDYSYDATGDRILQMLREAGFQISSDNKVQADNNGIPIKAIEFVVAGESSDHPAWSVFQNAKEILNKIGFEISVNTKPSALDDLTHGGLTVWAAAWSSTIDPDMYQVYHMNAKGSSTMNWGYTQIKSDREKYGYEYNIIVELSEIIEEARTTIDEDVRARYYWDALDLVMELAVEFPLYQRSDLTVYNSEKIDSETLNQNTNAYDSLFNKIWEVGYNADFKG